MCESLSAKRVSDSRYVLCVELSARTMCIFWYQLQGGTCRAKFIFAVVMEWGSLGNSFVVELCNSVHRLMAEDR